MSLIFALKGRQGDKGDDGEKGDDGDKGDKGDKGDAGFFTSFCSAYRSADQSITTGTWTRINWNRVLYDNDSEFDIVTNYRFVAKTAGLFHVSGQLFYLFINAGVLCQARIKVTGVTKKETHRCHYAQVNEFVPFQGDVVLDVDDYIEIWAHHGNGNTQKVSGLNYRTWVDIYQIG